MRTARLCRRAAAMAGLALLAGCAGQGVDETVIACPSVQIAVPSDQIGHSDDDGRIRFVATIEQLTSGCRVDGDHLAVDLAFRIKAERGPVFQEEPISLTYYIATVDPNRQIVDKELLDVDLTLSSDQAASVIAEALTLQLPTPDGAGGANYNLYLGFQPDL